MKKVKTIIRKEWAEVFKNRMVVFSVIFMPLLFTALPLILLFATSESGLGDLSTDMPAQFSRFCSPTLTAGECFQVYLASQFIILFLMMPLMIPVNIAAYSIVGEKTTHSLEPLLATPITTAELLAGKNLAAVLPAVGATWAGFAVYCLGTIIITSPQVAAALLSTTWFIAILLLGPLMAVLSVNFSIMVSSRVNRSALCRANFDCNYPARPDIICRSDFWFLFRKPAGHLDRNPGSAAAGLARNLPGYPTFSTRDDFNPLEIAKTRRKNDEKYSNLLSRLPGIYCGGCRYSTSRSAR